jgi:hypothetical protein
MIAIMNVSEKPLPVIASLPLKNGCVGIVRALPTIPRQAIVEMYDPDRQPFKIPNREGKFVEFVNIEDLGGVIRRNPSFWDLRLLADALIKEGVISHSYEPQNLSARSRPENPRRRGWISEPR